MIVHSCLRGRQQRRQLLLSYLSSFWRIVRWWSAQVLSTTVAKVAFQSTAVACPSSTSRCPSLWVSSCDQPECFKIVRRGIVMRRVWQCHHQLCLVTLSRFTKVDLDQKMAGIRYRLSVSLHFAILPSLGCWRSTHYICSGKLDSWTHSACS